MSCICTKANGQQCTYCMDGGIDQLRHEVKQLRGELIDAGRLLGKALDEGLHCPDFSEELSDEISSFIRRMI